MKTKSLLSLVLGLASATSLMATDVYITGSTAFRSQVYNACARLYVNSKPTAIYYGTNSAVGGDTNLNSSTAAWCMTGTAISQLSKISDTLVIHALFNGSIQGIKAVTQEQRLHFPSVGGNLIANSSTTGQTPVAGVPLYGCTTFVDKRPTIGFSDSGNAACPYQLTGNTLEEDVAVQPFVFCKSVGWGAAALAVSNINNVSWEQLAYGIPQGRIPLSAWTYKNSDTNTFIYLLQRTKDSGTRRVETAMEYFQYGDIGTYIYDRTNNSWFLPSQTTLTATAFGASPNGVVGAPGLVNIETGIPANLEWGYGYVGGGDIKASLNLTNGNGALVPSTANQAIAMLSLNDAKGVGASNWANVVSFNGIWPTTDGANIRGHSGTNDFSPITAGYYSGWGKEVLVHIVDPTAMVNNDQAITADQIGDNTTAGSFLGVFNAQTLNNGGSPSVGSIENEIELSKAGGAVAIRLSDMNTERSSVGSVISPK